MPTDDKYVRMYNKRILPLTQFKDNFLDYMRNYIESVQSANYNLPTTIGLIAVPITAPGNNNVTVGNTGGPFKGTTGLGGIIKFGNADSRLTAVVVPPLAVRFDVGLERALVDDGVEVNPRTGEIEYSNIREEIGRMTTPDLVVNNGGVTLTFRVDAIFGTDDATGRTVRVWLKSKQTGGLVGPQSSDPAVAFETRTVSFVGGHNVITTAAILGQNSASPSTTAADYRICAVGPTIRKHSVEDLTTTSGCWFIGFLTGATAGNPCTGLSTAGQNLVSATLSDLAPILRRDAHLSLKLRVKADASDANEPQIDVWDSANNVVFVINETGNLIVSASAGVAGRFNSVGANAAVQANAAGTGNAYESVKGDVQIPAANKYKFAAVRSRSQHIPASAFSLDKNFGNELGQPDVRRNPATAGAYHNGAITLSAHQFGTHARCSSRAPVRLPHGAAITSMTVLYSVEDGTTTLNHNFTISKSYMQLLRKTFSGTVAISKLNPSAQSYVGNSSGNHDSIAEQALAFSHTVDNTDATYELVNDMGIGYWLWNNLTNLLPCTGGGAACSALRDGRVLITGGRDGGGGRTDAYIYDPVTAQLTTVTSMATGRANHRQFTFESGKVVVIGGHSDTGGIVGVNTCEVYDPEANSWSTCTGTITNCIDMQCIMSPSGNLVYCLGGYNTAHTGTPRLLTTVNDTQVFANTGPGSDRTSACLVWYKPVQDEIRLAAIGGGAAWGSTSTTWASYNHFTDTWTAGTNNLATGVGLSMVQPTPNGNVIIIANNGGSSVCYTGHPTADAVITWAALTAPPVNLSGDISFTLPSGEIFCLQGSGGFNNLRFCPWDPATATNSWKVSMNLQAALVEDGSFASAEHGGNGGNHDACMLPNGEIIVVSTRDVYHVDPLWFTTNLARRKPTVRFYGVRINYDYTEVNAET